MGYVSIQYHFKWANHDPDLCVLSCINYSYGERPITDAEWATLPVREQERVRRSNVNNQMSLQNPGMWPGAGFSPSPNKDRFRRADWLRDKM